MTPLVALVTYVTLAVALFGLFARGDRAVDEGTRGDVARWLSRDGDVDWAQAFLTWFDRVFAVRERKLPGLGSVHVPAFWRSVLASFLSLFVLTLVWVINKDTLSRELRFSGPAPGFWDEASVLLLVYGSATLITNWLPDYLSLIQSRLVMERMARARSSVARMGWLALDVVGTLAVAFGALYVGTRLVLPVASKYLTVEVGCFTPELYDLGDAAEIFWAGLTWQTPPATLNYDAAGIYVWSTFLTSAWVWIYLSTGLLVRLAARARTLPRVIQGRPLRSLGLVALVAFTGVFWVHRAQSMQTRADVLVATSTAERATAERLVGELRDAGLIVRLTEFEDGEELEPQTAGAELLLVVGPTGEPATESAFALAHRQAQAGQRTRGSVAWFPIQYKKFLGDDPTLVRPIRAGYGRPAGGSTEMVEWAQGAHSLLDVQQLKVCQERFEDEWNRPAEPAEFIYFQF